ncbi:hypothetical protein Q0M41_13615, partial [Staphylococcus aureus]|nr:hypothetical protein [Staphylococcus aureus]
MLPLGALAAGFGLLLPAAHAQSTAPAEAVATQEQALPEIRVRGSSEPRSGKEALQTKKTNIG